MNDTNKKSFLRSFLEKVSDTVSTVLEVIFLYAIITGGIAIAFCAYSIEPHHGRKLVGAVLLASAIASLLAGYFLGFLFGIPKYTATQQQNATANKLTPNTNLTDISDWLTKIVIGVGLVELKKLPHLFQSIGEFVANQTAPLCGTTTSKTLEVYTDAIILYFGIFGVWYGYNYVRVILTQIYVHTETKIRDHDNEVSGNT